MSKLQDVINLLLSEAVLPSELKDHALKGDWRPNRDLHIEPDWILIYTIEDDIVRLERTGSHSDIFG